MEKFFETESLFPEESEKIFLEQGEGDFFGQEKIKRKRGRPPFSEEKKAQIKAKRDAGKTKRFSVGEEPNKRMKDGK